METFEHWKGALAVLVTLVHRLEAGVAEPLDQTAVQAASPPGAVPFQEAVEAGRRLGWVAVGADGQVSATAAGRNAAGHSIAWPSAAREGPFRLASPVSPKYDAARRQALLADGPVSPADRRLVSTVEWLAREWKALSQGLPAPVELRGGISQETLLAVASVNRDYADAHRSAGGRGVFSDNALNQPVAINDYNDAIGDSLGQWLRDASVTGAWPEPGPWSTGLDGIAAERVHRFSRKHALFDFFQQGLWEGWAVRGAGDADQRPVWTPDDEGFAKRTFAWNLRTRTSPGSDPARISEEWARKTRAERRNAHLWTAV